MRIDRNHTLPIKRQAELLSIGRSTVYYRPRPVSDGDLQAMRRIDAIHLARPTAGARMLRDILRREGLAIVRRHVATLMRRMGLEAIYRKPRTSDKNPGHADSGAPAALDGLGHALLALLISRADARPPGRWR